ncbi:hypothetical protein BGZ76_003718, partial [Entomortierella beljakovae]
FLDKPSLAAAAAVSKSWHETILPTLYSSAYWTQTRNLTTPKSIKVRDAFLLHHVHVRNLYLWIEAEYNQEELNYFNCFTNLYDVNIRIDNPSADFWLWIPEFLQRNSQIHKFGFESLYMRKLSAPDIYRFLAQLPELIPNVRRLSLKGGIYKAQVIRSLIYKLGEKLVELSVINLQLEEEPEDSTNHQTISGIPQSLPKLRVLESRNLWSVTERLGFVDKSPSLKSICLSTGGMFSSSYDGGLITTIQNGILGNCFELENMEIEGQLLRDEDLARIIGNCQTGLSSIINLFGHFGPLAFQKLLPRHTATLTNVTIKNAKVMVTSPMVQKILTSCYQLKVIRADMLNAQDILADEFDIDHSKPGDKYIEDEEIDDYYFGMPDEAATGEDEDGLFDEVEYAKAYQDAYGDRYRYTSEGEEGSESEGEEGSENDEYVDECTSEDESVEETEEDEIEEEGLRDVSRKWVCTNLEYFDIFIYGLRNRPYEWHESIFKRISKLRRLKTLRVGIGRGLVNRILVKNFYTLATWDGLDISIDSGLRNLDTLSELATLDFYYLDQELEQTDVEWMIRHWPKLKEVFGYLSDDIGYFGNMSDLLNRYEIINSLSDAINSENFRRYRHHS